VRANTGGASSPYTDLAPAVSVGPSGTGSTGQGGFMPGWNTGDYSAGLGQKTFTLPTPDYFSLNGSALGIAGNISVNVHNGQTFLGGSASLPLQPSAKILAGYIIGIDSDLTKSIGDKTDLFLGGAGSSFGGNIFGVYTGINHSFGGLTANEVGVGTPGLSMKPNLGGSGGTGVTVPFVIIPGIGK